MQSQQNNELFEISESIEYGVILKINDLDVADDFEDFINEKIYVLADNKIELNYIQFYFGIVSSAEKVKGILEKFILFMKEKGTPIVMGSNSNN